jgi:hypothetical protein
LADPLGTRTPAAAIKPTKTTNVSIRKVCLINMKRACQTTGYSNTSQIDEPGFWNKTSDDELQSPGSNLS